MDAAKEIGERIKEIIDALGITQTEFAAKLNISQSMVSKMCSGASEPSSRTISDICDKFNIDDFWLVTGFGEMFHSKSEDDVITKFLAKILANKTDPIYKEFVFAISQSTVEELEVIKEFATRLVKSTGDSETSQNAIKQLRVTPIDWENRK